MSGSKAIEQPATPAVSLKEGKAQVEKLVGLFIFYVELLNLTQQEIGVEIAAIAKERGLEEALPILQETMRKMQAAVLPYLEAPPLKM